MTLNNAVASFVEWRALKSKPRTINGYMRNLVHFALFIRKLDTPVESIMLEDCIEYLNLCRQLGYDENTINKKAISLKLLFDYLRDRDVKVLNPSLIPIPKKEFRFPRVANEEDYRKLLACIPEVGKMGKPLYWHIRNKAIIMLLWDTGARNGEIANLELDDIDLDRMSARIKTEKSRGTIPFREIFWRSDTNEALAAWLDAREDFFKDVEVRDRHHVFIGIKGGYGSKNDENSSFGRRLQVNYVSEILRKYSNRAGLQAPLNPHSFRHHMGRDLAMKGVIAHGISSILGHAQVQSSYPYTMLFGKDREKLYRENVGR